MLIDCPLDAWDIPEEKILLVVTDNGANIVKAISLLQNRQENTRDQQQPEQTIALNGAAEMTDEGTLASPCNGFANRLPEVATLLAVTVTDRPKQPFASVVRD